MNCGRGLFRRIFFVFSLFAAATSYHAEVRPPNSLCNGHTLPPAKAASRSSARRAPLGLCPGGHHRGDVTSYIDASLNNGGHLLLRVRAFNTAVASAFSNETCATTAANSTLQWTTTSTGQSGFKIERKTGTAGTYAQVATTAANVTSYIDASLTTGATYCYRVRPLTRLSLRLSRTKPVLPRTDRIPTFG